MLTTRLLPLKIIIIKWIIPVILLTIATLHENFNGKRANKKVFYSVSSKLDHVNLESENPNSEIAQWCPILATVTTLLDDLKKTID